MAGRRRAIAIRERRGARCSKKINQERAERHFLKYLLKYFITLTRETGVVVVCGFVVSSCHKTV